MTISDALQKNNNIIINTDIDGLLSGLILTNHLNCRVAGFSNSANKVWLNPTYINSVYDGVYIDMYVAHPDVITIEQHIIAANSQHREVLQANANKINPNLERGRFFMPNDSYYLKYPFGTIHYLIAKLEQEGIKIQMNLNREFKGVRLGDVILRADDAMTTTLCSAYVDNAQSWWEWLLKISNNGELTSKFKKYLDLCPRGYEWVRKKKNWIGQWFNTNYQCESPDGGYNDIMDNNGYLLKIVKTYILDIAELAGLTPFNLDDQYTLHTGLAKRAYFTGRDVDNLISGNTFRGDEVFSYGFVRTSNRDNNFSYTVQMR